MVQIPLYQHVAVFFITFLPSFALSQPPQLPGGIRSAERRCGTHTSPKDIASIQELISVGSYPGFDGLQARDRVVGRDVKYPWGNATVWTWIHVIASSASTNISDGYVPDSQVHAQMDYVNRMFAPTNFQFKLEGITRTSNPVWAVDTNDTRFTYRAKLRRGDYSTLNLYFIEKPYEDRLGYATYPTKDPVGFYDNDSVTAGTGYLTGSSDPFYNKGANVVHEMGHWFSLLHTFGAAVNFTADGEAIYDCDLSTDMISDTPAENGPSFACQIGRDSCPDRPGLDPIHNFMDYSDDNCVNEFTPLQVKRMWDAWFYFRKRRTCKVDKCLQAMRAPSIRGRLKESQAFCTSITQTIVTEVTAFKDYAVSACAGNVASRVSSACSCLPGAPTWPPYPEKH